MKPSNLASKHLLNPDNMYIHRHADRCYVLSLPP